MTDLLLRGGLVADGAGGSPVRADLLIRQGKVRQVAPGLACDTGDVQVRDVTGAVVCPGFVDIHTHSDLTLLSNPAAPSKIQQGVTTEVVGNCGLGIAPLTANTDIAALRSAVSYLDLDPAVQWGWTDTAGYLDAVRAARTSVNVATLTAHIPLRAATVGFGARPADTAELDRMRGLLRDSFDQGALGVSTGLVYAPVCFADQRELLALGAEAARADRVFAWHVRDYGDELLPSVGQALAVARETGCRTQISHLAAVGRRNWGSVARALEMVDGARESGVDVHVDTYPYLAGNAPLVQLLPSWAQEGDAADLAARLRDPTVRRHIREAWHDRAVGWEEVAINWLPPEADTDIVAGESIALIASRRGCDGDDVVLDVLADLGTAVMMIAGGRSEDDMRTALAHPASLVASDGLSLDPRGATGHGAPHPRCYGCFPRYLAGIAASSGSDLGDAIRRCTAAPAGALGLTDRGVLRVGAPADVVVFDPGRIADRATFTEPQRFPDGIDLVVVAGEIVVDAGRHTGARPGSILRR